MLRAAVKKRGIQCTNLCVHFHEDLCYNLFINTPSLESEVDSSAENDYELDSYNCDDVTDFLQPKRTKIN